MVRRRKRFNFLEKALKKSGGQAAPGSAVANFKDFKEGRRKITISNPAPVNARRRRAVALLPFNFQVPASPTADDRYRASITEYSNASRIDAGLTNTLVGYEAIDAANRQDPTYKPAQLKLFIPVNNRTVTNVPNAGVTGEAYKRVNGKSATVPFGRGGATLAQDQQTRRLVLAETAKGATDGNKASSVSFVPETFTNVLTDIPGLSFQA